MKLVTKHEEKALSFSEDFFSQSKDFFFFFEGLARSRDNNNKKKEREGERE